MLSVLLKNNKNDKFVIDLDTFESESNYHLEVCLKKLNIVSTNIHEGPETSTNSHDSPEKSISVKKRPGMSTNVQKYP